MITAPNVENRRPGEFAAEVRALLTRDMPSGWPRKGSGRGDAGEALIEVFAHLCGTVAERLNRAPYKNLLAFLNLQGINLRPAQAARAPLTFQLAAQYRGSATVPAKSQVAATPRPGEAEPVIFETEEDLVLTAAKLIYIGAKDESLDLFSDASFLTSEAPSQAVSIFSGTTPIEHLMFFDVAPALPAPLLQELRVRIGLSQPARTSIEPWSEWLLWTERGGAVVAPAEDGTDGLGESGEVVFRGLPDLPRVELAGVKGQWLACRLTRLERQLPSLEEVHLIARYAGQAIPPEAAFANQVVLDLTKEFFPFGMRPKFGDTFYLAALAPLRYQGSIVTLHFTVANADQENLGVSIVPVRATAVKLRCEIGNGKVWEELGTAESGREMHNEATAFSDTTRAFTRSGVVTFRVPSTLMPGIVNRVNSIWVRVRIVGGDYGLDAHYEKTPAGGVTATPAEFAPPCLGPVAIDFALETTSVPTALAYNDFRYARVDLANGPVPFFRFQDEAGKWAYFGFADESHFSGRMVSIYVAVANPVGSSTPFETSGAVSTIVWEYWNGRAWAKSTLLDETGGLTRSGLLRFVVPRDFTASEQFGRTLHWFRFRPAEGSSSELWVNRVALNTVFATQAATAPAEVLGSSNGAAGQRFVTTRKPVIEGQKVEVREPLPPSPEQRAIILEEEGLGAIRPADDLQRRAGDVWVRWHEVPSFEASGGDERHYLMDRVKGEILFGDGVNGRIPPAGSRNVRIDEYRVGGGSQGNRDANNITQFRTTIPYVEKVTNLDPARGGVDAETYESMLSRAPRQIRHRWRAVTAQDFEDLARLASPEVARARCVPLRDLSKNLDANLRKPGVVSLIIAPASDSSPGKTVLDGPKPSRELLDRVRRYIDAQRPVETDLVITGPEYVAIKVEAEITITADATPSAVEDAASAAIIRFLNPITGHRDGSGWQFGQEPTRSDLFALLEDLPGVDHVRALKISAVAPRSGVYASRHFLIFATEPQVTATLET